MMGLRAGLGAPQGRYHVRCGCPGEPLIVDAEYPTSYVALQQAQISANIEACPCWVKDPNGNIWPVEPKPRDFGDTWRILSPLVGGGLGLWAAVSAFRRKPSMTAQVLLGVWAIWTAASGSTQALHAVTQKRYGGGP